MTKMSAEDIYKDGTYLDKNPTWHEEDSRWKANQITRILEKNRMHPSTICELGCGAGAILECLAEDYGDKVSLSGYEVSPQAYEICRKKEKQNLHFFLKDLLQEGSSSFDVVMAIDVLEHVEDCYGLLRRLRSKGEYKIFHIPLDLSVQMVFRNSRILELRALIGHIHYFTKDTALATLRDTGYEIVDYCYTCGALELPGRSWKSNLLRLPRKLSFFLHQDLAARILGGFSLLVLAK